MNINEKRLHQAAELAGDSRDDKNYYLGCIGIRHDNVLVKSVNHFHSGQQVPDHHAEARVLKKAGYGAILYVARVLKCDKVTWANARPCTTCRNIIKSRGVKKVYYTVGPSEYGVWNVVEDFEQGTYSA